MAHPAFEELAQRLCDCNKEGFLRLLFADIDRLIYHNDSFGHISGDKVISDVQDLLTAFAEENSATLCRIGGDEFLLYAIGNDKSVELSGGEVVQRVRELNIPLVAEDYRDSHLIQKTITVTVADITFPMWAIGHAPHPRVNFDIKKSQVEFLMQLADSLVAAGKMTKRGRAIRLNLVEDATDE
jgi:diguanylate cyclase (GGDEF)-like protein